MHYQKQVMQFLLFHWHKITIYDVKVIYKRKILLKKCITETLFNY